MANPIDGRKMKKQLETEREMSEFIACWVERDKAEEFFSEANLYIWAAVTKRKNLSEGNPTMASLIAFEGACYWKATTMMSSWYGALLAMIIFSNLGDELRLRALLQASKTEAWKPITIARIFNQSWIQLTFSYCKNKAKLLRNQAGAYLQWISD